MQRFVLPFGVAVLCLVPAAAEETGKAGLDWWSLQPVRRAELPKVQAAERVRNAIDAFVLAKLEAKGLTLSADADRETLLRRIYFDLTGLPPTPTELDDFVNDQSPNAYEKIVDRLLAAPQYGERWARHWLDAVRFAESQGFEYDRIRDHAWRYRDYVIGNLNADKPYARFVAEQLAGDALPDATPESIVATGFLVAGPFDQAGSGSASELLRAKVREDEMEDMLSAVSQTFLGLTANCARCHNHKFDPIPAKDYYKLKAVFDGVRHGDRTIVDPRDTATARRIAEVEKELAVKSKQLEELEAIGIRIVNEKKKGKAEPTDKLPRPLARWTFEGHSRDVEGKLHAELIGGAVIRDGRLVVDGKKAFAQTAPIAAEIRTKTLEAWVILPDRSQRGGGVISLQTKNGQLFDAIVFGEREPRKWMAGSNGYVRTKELKAGEETAELNKAVHMAIVYSADNRITVYRNGEPYGESYVPAVPLQTYSANDAVILFGMRHSGGGNAMLAGEIEEARLYDRALSAAEVNASFRAGLQRISRDEILAVLAEDQQQAYRRIEAEMLNLRKLRPMQPKEVLAYAANSRPPGPTHVLWRGDVEQKKDVVTGSGLSAIQSPAADLGLTAETPEGERRRKFAAWVANPEHPLTWRVIANRLWQHHFGEGIVRTPNDFGFNGERPTHPELLDFLAAQLRDSGGSLKSLHRTILLSTTYRQSSAPNPKAAQADAENRLLWRYPLRRLEAEVVRDAMLALGGSLNLKAGGPGYRPFRIETFNSAFYVIEDADKPEFNRRSIYRININSAKDPLLDVFDCPDPSVKTPRRNTTTTPLQALSLMNNTFVLRQAKHFAERLEKEAGKDPGEQIKQGYRMAFGRSPTREEVQRAEKTVRDHGLASFCWVLFNAGEMVYQR